MSNDTFSLQSLEDFLKMKRAEKQKKEVEKKEKWKEYTYTDYDSLHQEISDIFSFGEQKEIQTVCSKAYSKEIKAIFGEELEWKTMKNEQKTEIIEIMLENLELKDLKKRLRSLCTLLYISAGLPNEFAVFEQRLQQIINNNRLMNKSDALTIFINYLIMLSFSELSEKPSKHQIVKANYELRLILNLLLVLIEVNKGTPEFVEEITGQFVFAKNFIFLPFKLISDANDHPQRKYPIKKILLLLWKLLLFSGESLKSENTKNDPIFKLKSCMKDKVEFVKKVDEKYSNFFPDIKKALPRAFEDGLETIEKYMHDPNNYNAKPKATKFENFYELEFPNITRYLIILLNIMLSAMPFGEYEGPIDYKNEFESINNKDSKNGNSILQNVKNNLDSERTKEIILKAISAILLLLLKRAKANHVLQFEYLCQILVDSNTILMLLKLFNIDLKKFIKPAVIIEDELFLPPETFEQQNNNENKNETEKEKELEKEKENENEYKIPKASLELSWRRIFTLINLIRILQKLIKNKPNRVKTNMRFKQGTPILEKLLKLDVKVVSFYTLKVLKNLMRFMGKQWIERKMNIISEMYIILGSGLNSDWLFPEKGEKLRSDKLKLLDKTLREHVSNFNIPYSLRSNEENEDSDSDSDDYDEDEYDDDDVLQINKKKEDLMEESVDDILNQINLKDNWKDNYEQWLEKEVFSGNSTIPSEFDEEDSVEF
ncbi:protein required for hyphal anastomosis ham-2 [Anaeramoeba flamelloides]|uniref:Protein required for hyphal anastomosis ham-2 n=1 Tax=Anaeramoeba flamelloides TaxID=1746091 RepID=A0AAV7YGG5_9EUKA|nr:protein required for hyphal anastomosis ham-2 [Anaeramoeba flamelloides]